jgi:hypothetical protein
LLLLQNSEFLSGRVNGGHRNEGKNNNLGIATASTQVICTCDPLNTCTCAASFGKGKGRRVSKNNETTKLPSYSNITTTQFTKLPRDPHVSAERGKISPLSRTS